MRKHFVCLFVVVSLLLAFSMNADRRRPARPWVEPTYLTKQTSLSVVGPDAEGKYKVPFSAWFPVPEGTTMSFYTVEVSGNKTYVGSWTVTAENADRGWAGNLWGKLTNGALIPSNITGFRVEFTGNFQAYSVNAKVPDGTRTTKVVDVYPNGMLFLMGPYSTPPVASLNGRGHPIVNGWITPAEFFTGPDVVVAVCSGYPESWCQTQIVDIPTPSTEQNKSFREYE